MIRPFDGRIFDRLDFDCSLPNIRKTLGGWTKAARRQASWSPYDLTRGTAWGPRRSAQERAATVAAAAVVPPPEAVGFWQLDFSDPDQSGLLALLLDDFELAAAQPYGALDFSNPDQSGLLALPMESF